VKIGRLMVESCAFPLYEIENGCLKLTGKSLSIAKSGRKKLVDEYIGLQGRFKKITPEQVAEFQRRVDDKWQALLNRAGF
jgi:pyruvate ferredoxin oxidoreductase beta subunit